MDAFVVAILPQEILLAQPAGRQPSCWRLAVELESQPRGLADYSGDAVAFAFVFQSNHGFRTRAILVACGL